MADPDFNRQVWESAALLQRLDAITGSIFETLSYKIDTANKKYVNVPVLTCDTEAQDTGDTVIVPITKTLIQVPTDLKNYFGFELTDDEMHTTDVNLANDKMKIAMSKIFKRIEIRVTEEMVTSCHADNKLQFQNLDAGATFFTLDSIYELQKIFDEAEIPTEGRYLRVTPKHYKSLMLIKDPDTNEKLFIKTEKNDSLIKAKGILGEIAGFMVQKSNRITKVTTAGAVDATPANNTQYVTLAYHSGSCAIGLNEAIIIRQQEDAVTDGGRDIMTPKQYWGRKVIRSTEIWAIRDNTP